MLNEPLQGPPWTIIKLLQWTSAYFQDRIPDHPRLEAELLLAHALGCRRLDLYLRYDQPLDETELAFFRRLIQRRARREPTAYIVGHKEFWSLQLDVTPAVLIPRPDTESLVEAALQTIALPGFDFHGRILELGAGSGAVSIALAKELPQVIVIATDIDSEAVILARRNACRHSVGGRIHFLVGCWMRPFKAAAARFDLIVSNPPYVATGDLQNLPLEIRAYEPRRALDGGDEGLDSLKRIINAAPAYLEPGGFLLLEMGFNQKEALEKEVRDCAAYDEIVFQKDYAGHHRVMRLRKDRLCSNSR